MDQDPTPRRPQHPYGYATHDSGVGSSNQAPSQSGRARSWHAQGAAGNDGAHRRPHVHFTNGGGDSTEDPIELSSDGRNESRTLIQSSTERKKGKMRDDSVKLAQGEGSASQGPISRTSSFDGEDPDAYQPDFSDDEHHDNAAYVKAFSQTSAFERAQTLAHSMGHHSEPLLRYPASPVSTAPSSPPRPLKRLPKTVDEIPLVPFGRRSHRGQGHGQGDSHVDQSRQRDGHDKSKLERLRQILSLTIGTSEEDIGPPGLRSGRVTPISERDPDNYVPPPDKYRRGVLSMLLKYNGIGPLNKDHSNASPGTYSDRSRPGSGTHTPVAEPDGQVDRPRRAGGGQTPGIGSNTRRGSGQVTARSKHPKWYDKNPSPSSNSLAGLVESSSVLALPAAGSVADTSEPKVRPHVRKVTPPISKGAAAAASIFGGPNPGVEDEIRISVHIATTLARQHYLAKLCRALMAFGAPTHRLEGVSIYNQRTYPPGLADADGITFLI